MVYEYSSPVRGMSLAFYCIEDSVQRAEMWTKRLTIPAASIAKTVEALALYSIRYFSLTEKARVRIAPEPLFQQKTTTRDCLT